MLLTFLSLSGVLIWLSILLAPWRPWSTREFLDARSPIPEADLRDITVVVPARDEADLIEITLSSLKKQGRNLNVVLVDDQSTDRGSPGQILPEFMPGHGNSRGGKRPPVQFRDGPVEEPEGPL